MSPNISRVVDTMDNFPTALFDSYEQDFRQIIDSIRSELDKDGEERGGTCSVLRGVEWLAHESFSQKSVKQHSEE